MDSASAEQAGAAPLKNELDRIAAIASPRDLLQALARGHRHGWEPLFNLGASPDFKNSTVMGTTASQGGLGLPDRDYYLRSDSTARALRAAYLEFRSEEHTSELKSRLHLVCRLLLEKKKKGTEVRFTTD